MHHTLILSLLASTALAGPCRPRAVAPGEIKCPIIFDGRVEKTTELTDFDSYGTSIFNPDYVKGNNIKWSEIIKFPTVNGSRFDDEEIHKPFEVTISDQSIFQQQRGFRRAGLQFQGDTNSGSPGSSGIKTLHFSVKWDAQRAFNLSHEYLNVWHEAGDYSSNQFNFQAGAIIGQSSLSRDSWKVLDRKNKQIWSTPILKNGEWQNFAITLNFQRNTLRVYYSKGNEPLKSVTNAVSNDNSGQGQYQIGVLKKPTGTSDVVNSGYQQKNLNEGLIYGGLFLEDSANDCISL